MVFLDRILRRSFSHNFAVSGTKSTFNGLLIAAIISDGGFIRRSKAHCVVFGRAAAFFCFVPTGHRSQRCIYVRCAAVLSPHTFLMIGLFFFYWFVLY